MDGENFYLHNKTVSSQNEAIVWWKVKSPTSPPYYLSPYKCFYIPMDSSLEDYST